MVKTVVSIARGALAISLSLSLAAGPVAAGPVPPGLSDIAYQDTGWGAGQLRARGWVLISSDDHEERVWEYWWSAGSNTCLKAVAIEGKYDSLAATASTDCNQYHAEATKDSPLAAIAVGAAALLGLAALAHKSHEREDKHEQDAKSVAEFERGYRDGLHHERYHNYQNTAGYSDGYNAGQVERDKQTSHRAREGRHSGYQRYVSLDDLVGARASSADSDLRARGFREAGGYKQGDRSFTTWWNPDTRQCVQAMTRDGKVKRIEGIYEGNCR